MNHTVDFIVALDKRIRTELAQPTPNAALIAQLRNMIFHEKLTSNQRLSIEYDADLQQFFKANPQVCTHRLKGIGMRWLNLF
jgi:hypothetical protein